MTDREVFEKFMHWMGMPIDKSMMVEEGEAILYNDEYGRKQKHESFTTCGYEEFHAGAIFDADGKMVRGYMDSHVAHLSDNCKDIENMFRNAKPAWKEN